MPDDVVGTFLAELQAEAQAEKGLCSDCGQWITVEPHLCNPEQTVLNMQQATFALLVSGLDDPQRRAKGYSVR